MGSWVLLLAFLHLSFAKTPDPQYVLIVPSVLHSDTSNQACVQLQHLNETVSTKVVLEYHMDHHDLWEGRVDEQHFSRCINFTVPPAAPEPLAFVVLSVEGPTLKFHERRSVALRNRSTAVFIQTDKPIYKPGQTVMFRIITLDEDYKPVNQMYTSIHIMDPQGNKLAQWLDQAPSKGFVQLEFQLDDHPNLGSYGIIVEVGKSYPTSRWFSVEEYVLPTFSVTTDIPQRVSPFDEEFKVDVCAKYTYGQPVQGTVQLRVCRQRYFHPRCGRDSDGICEALSAKLGKDGCISELIPTKAFQLYTSQGSQGRDRYFFLSLHVNTVVTENGTGIQISHSDFVSVYQSRKTISLQNVDPYYRRGLLYTGQIRLRDEDDSPIANGLIFLELEGEVVANYTTDKNGTVEFSIPTSSLFQPRYKLRVYHQPDQCTDYGWLEREEPETTYYIQRFFSRTDSFVKVEPVLEEPQCGQERPVTVHYIINTGRPGEKISTLDFFYIVMTQGKIVASGKQEVSIQVGEPGTFSISLDVDDRLAPRARMLVYILHDGELVADSVSFEVEKCFRNKVSLQFSEQKALPASSVSLDIEAESNSICALRATDKSVLLLRPGDDLTAESVFSQLSHGSYYGYYFGGLNLEDEPEEPCIRLRDAFFNGLYYLPVNVTDDGNVYDIVKNMGLKVFTHSTLRKPVVCQSDLECKKISSGYDGDDRPPLRTSEDAMGFAGKGFATTVRQFFPETWIWTTVPVNSSGKASLVYTVPDTITEWQASMFCVEEDTGFGIAKPVHMVAFQPFFVEMTMPYSIIRGESFVLLTNIYNYQNHCIEVKSIFKESEDYKVENLSPENDFSRICANERKTYTWRIDPLKLGTVNLTVTGEAKPGELSVGRRDTVIRPLLVEPEGVKKEVTQSALICVKGTSVSEAMSLKLPQNLVEGSEKAYFSVLGDVLGTAISSTESLLQMPSGCAEQNIAMTMANLVILNYLNDTKQLTEEKKQRYTGHLAGGYQRQMSYRLHDGSFSTFGNRDGEGNLWLTILTYKVLAKCKEHIFVDSNVLDQALNWIASKQDPDGCFRQAGSVFNNAVKEGGNYSLLLTAKVAASLLEAGRPSSYPVVQHALSCLDTASSRGVESTYEKALLAYTYSLVDDEEKHKKFLEDLKASATRTGGFIYWEREKRPAAEVFPSFYTRATSLDIETTGYAILAFLNQPDLTPEQLTEASQMVRWTVRQQNPHGGFASTQDTYVALQALSKYGVLTFVKDAQNTVKVSSTQGPFQAHFQVNSQNRILLQRVALPRVPGNYSVEVTGSGCAYVQTTLRYNVILPAQASGFSLAVQTANASCSGNFLPRFHLHLTFRYTGERNSSNMVIIDTKMLSGYAPVKTSLETLRDKVMRTETRNDHVLFYLSSVSSKPTTLTFQVEETHPVSNIKPAQVKIYDYYETDESALAQYNTACPKVSA